MKSLEGKKTYILAVAALITIAGTLLGYVDAEVGNTMLAILGFGGLITLRAAVK